MEDFLLKYVRRAENRRIVYKDKNVKLDAIFERKTLGDNDPIKVLNHINGFYYMNLYDEFLIGDNKNQEIFFVVNGCGEISLNKQRKRIEKDYAFILPVKMRCVAKNMSKQSPLEMLVITEEPPRNSNKDVLIRDSDNIPFNNFNPPLHWCHKSKTIFNYEKDGLGETHYISLVYIEPERLAEPHAHFPGHDEVWYALEGKTKMAFNETKISHNPETAIFIPDNGKIRHATITDNEKAKFFFFMHHMALDNRLLITGSRGTIGSIITEHLKNNGYQFLTEIDKDNPRNPVDILNDDINKYFRNVDTVIHLAANPNPFIEKDEAKKNIKITKKVIDACKQHPPKRIINASSINVYPYRDIERITIDTKLEPNTFVLDGKSYREYGKAKIESERLLENYCREKNISLLNLRLGWVTRNDKHPPYTEDKPHPKDIEVALKHEDLKRIIDKAIKYRGIGSYVCVSKKDGFIENSVLFPM